MTKATERAVLDECDLAMEYNNIAPELRQATKLVSVLPTLEKYADRPHSGPFWLLKRDAVLATAAIASSEVFQGKPAGAAATAKANYARACYPELDPDFENNSVYC